MTPPIKVSDNLQDNEDLIQCDVCHRWFKEEDIEIIGGKQLCYGCADCRHDEFQPEII